MRSGSAEPFPEAEDCKASHDGADVEGRDLRWTDDGPTPPLVDPAEYETTDESGETSTRGTTVRWFSGPVKEEVQRRANADGTTARRFDRASALVAMAELVLRGRSLDRTPVELVVAVSAETLRATAAVTAAANVAVVGEGACITSHAARRLACDCGIVHAAETPDGSLLSIGRKSRSIPAALKRALRRRDAETCRFPGCTHRAFLQGHHIEHWADGGETALSNLVLMCSHHHRYVHEYGYEVTLSASNEATFRSRSGEVVSEQPPPLSLNGPLGLPSLRTRNRMNGLEITAATNACRWDGRRLDLGLAVDDLVRARGAVSYSAG